jgi:hypothetical protein
MYDRETRSGLMKTLIRPIEARFVITNQGSEEVRAHPESGYDVIPIGTTAT